MLLWEQARKIQRATFSVKQNRFCRKRRARAAAHCVSALRPKTPVRPRGPVQFIAEKLHEMTPRQTVQSLHDPLNDGVRPIVYTKVTDIQR